jgi:hypothetical protein
VGNLERNNIKMGLRKIVHEGAKQIMVIRNSE